MSSKYREYLITYAGRRLLEEHSLSEEGLWEVKGEDPNCDLGGPHHQPLLAYLEGKLEDVIREGVNLSGFWTWGAGGDFRKITPRKSSPQTAAWRAKMIERRKELETELKIINEELGE